MEPKIKKLAVSETFFSIQGEGQTMGVPAVFLRLGGCNLLCQSENWVCDSIAVWKKSKALEFKDVLLPEYIMKLQLGAHLVITGGEPLVHQEQIMNYLIWFWSKYEFYPTIEIETNGTIEPSKYLINNVSFWNVSPKLSTAGEQNKRAVRINETALRTFSSLATKAIFKFVISSDNDIKEIFADFSPLINIKQVVLMPAGSSQDELNKTRLMVVEHCRKLCIRYSDRLQVVIWDLAVGV